MNDRSFIPTLIARAEASAQPPLQPYKRADLEALLPKKFWLVISDHGEPDVDGDPDLQSIAASHCLYVINYVLRHADDSHKEQLEAAAHREGHSASMFLGLARARRAVITAIDPEPPVALVQPAAAAAPLKADQADRLTPSMAGLAPMRPFPRFQRSYPELTTEEEIDVLSRSDIGWSDAARAEAVPDGGGVSDGVCETDEPKPDEGLVARIAAVQPAESMRLGGASVRQAPKAKVSRSR